METATVTEDRTYNGWTNRATWLVNLHLTNDQGLYLHAREIVAEAHSGMTPLLDASDALRELVEDMTLNYYEAHGDGGSLTGLLVNDLVSDTLADVDWREVAEGLLEE